MANIKSQIKRNRQNEKARLRNKSVRSEMRSAIRKLEDAAASGEPTGELLQTAQSKIDSAVSKGVLKKTTAARKKSRLASRAASQG
jgi:small subunit ribosomal protein S20